MEPEQIRWFPVKYVGQGFVVSELVQEKTREYDGLK